MSTENQLASTPEARSADRRSNAPRAGIGGAAKRPQATVNPTSSAVGRMPARNMSSSDTCATIE